MKIYNKSNLLFTGMALLCSFWLSIKGAPIMCPLVGLIVWLAVQTTLNVHPTGDRADPNDRRIEQERAKRSYHMPIAIQGRYRSAFLPTGDLAISNHKRLLPLSWMVAAFTFLGTLTVYEDSLDYIGPIDLAKYYPVFGLMGVLLLADIYLAYRRSKNLFK